MVSGGWYQVRCQLEWIWLSFSLGSGARSRNAMFHDLMTFWYVLNPGKHPVVRHQVWWYTAVGPMLKENGFKRRCCKTKMLGTMGEQKMMVEYGRVTRLWSIPIGWKEGRLVNEHILRGSPFSGTSSISFGTSWLQQKDPGVPRVWKTVEFKQKTRVCLLVFFF